jgi:hypothetical protein
MTGDEDNRHVRPFSGDTLLQIQAIEAWKRNIKYKAARNNNTRVNEEFLGRSENLWLPASTPDHQFKRLADGDIVVNHEHNRRGLGHG